MKRVDVSLDKAIEKYLAGDLAFGSSEIYGIAEGCIEITDNAWYQANVSQEVRDTVEQAKQDIVDGKIDSSRTEAFLCPKGTGVELYATTLHYAPCSAKKGEGFRVVIVLPKGTNEDAPEITVANDNDKYLWARNKWLIAHPDSAEAADGAQVGITGDNIDIIDLI